jgi:hypothetical protein
MRYARSLTRAKRNGHAIYRSENLLDYPRPRLSCGVHQAGPGPGCTQALSDLRRMSRAATFAVQRCRDASLA